MQFEGGFGEGVQSWVGVAGLRPPLEPETQIIFPDDASLLLLGFMLGTQLIQS